MNQQEWLLNVEMMLEMGIEKGKEEGFISQGSSVVLLSDWRRSADRINTLRIMKVEQCNSGIVVLLVILFSLVSQI